MSVIQIHATMKAKPGREGALADAFASAVAATRQHPGVLNYQFYKATDGSFAVLESYKDAAAMGAHMAALGPDVMNAMMANVGEMSVSVFGPAPEELKAAIAGMAPTYFEHFAGFTHGA